MKIKILIISLLSIIPSLGLANNITAILDSIAHNNLELKAMQAEFKANSLDLRTTNNLQDPSIDFEYLFGAQSVGDKWAIGISQPFDWPGLYSARSKMINSKVSALSYLVIKRKIEILNQSKLNCIEIININQQLALQTEILNNIRQIKDAYEKGFSHGEISILDINKLKIELLNVQQNRISLIRKKESLISDLKTLNGNSPIDNNILNDLSNYPTYKLAPFEEYARLIKEMDPENNYFNQMKDVIENDIKISKLQNLPSFAIGYKYSVEIGDKFNGLTASVSIPLFSNRNKVNVNKAKLVANDYAMQNSLVNKEAKAFSDYTQLQTLNEQIRDYKEVLGNGDNLRLLKKALDGGQINLLSYLTEIKYFIEAQNQLIQMEYEYQEILTNLNQYVLL